MDDFENRAYNKKCKAEYEKCMTETDKGINLDGYSTGQKGNQSYPTDGAKRMCAMPGQHEMEDDIPNDSDEE